MFSRTWTCLRYKLAPFSELAGHNHSPNPTVLEISETICFKKWTIPLTWMICQPNSLESLANIIQYTVFQRVCRNISTPQLFILFVEFSITIGHKVLIN